MFNQKPFLLLAIILMVVSCDKIKQDMPLDAYLTEAEAKTAIENASPEDGRLIPNQTAIIHWATRIESTGHVKYRKVGTTKWTTIRSKSDLLHSVKIDQLKPGDKLEYSITIDLQDGSFEGDLRTFAISQGGLVFTQREYTFDVERDYQQHCAVEIENSDDQPHRVKATVFNPHADMIIGFVGDGSADKTIELASGEKTRLELVVHAQDADKEEYPFIVNAETIDGQRMKDSAEVRVKVKQMDFNLQVVQGQVHPATLATTLMLSNQGDRLTDFTLQPSSSLRGKVKIIPEISHALLEYGAHLKIQVLPILEIGMRELLGELVFSAAGKEKRVPILFTVPEGKQVFCAATQSVMTSEASTHFCTNRAIVDMYLGVDGLGPHNGSLARTDNKEKVEPTINYSEYCNGILSNPKTRQAVNKLGQELNADQIIVCGADRTKQEHEQLIESGDTETPYNKSQHGSKQGYKAADVKYFKDGKQIPPSVVAKKAAEVKYIGGIGVYSTFTHIDTRERKENGSVYKWGW